MKKKAKVGERVDLAAIRTRYEQMAPRIDERARRRLAATEAQVIGWGGITAVAQATGMSINAIRRGIAEQQQGDEAPAGRSRRRGGGRKKTAAKEPMVLEELERLVSPTTRGDPQSLLRWTNKGTRKLAKALQSQGYTVSHQWVAGALHELGYRLQRTRKTVEGGTHPDRDAQFTQIATTAEVFRVMGDPVISVDAKKRELVGNFANGGREWQPEGQPEQVNVYDFPSKELGRATPSGIYDVLHNRGWVNVGIDHNTATFAVESIRRWWKAEGQTLYPQSHQILILADGGSSNGSRNRLWKRELQQLAEEIGVVITVCHYPPGTSKWNKIEHRLFAWISENWRGKPLLTYAIIVSLIAATTTATGLVVHCELDTHTYPTKQKVTDEQMDALKIEREEFHGEWNYSLFPSELSY